MILQVDLCHNRQVEAGRLFLFSIIRTFGWWARGFGFARDAHTWVLIKLMKPSNGRDRDLSDCLIWLVTWPLRHGYAERWIDRWTGGSIDGQMDR